MMPNRTNHQQLLILDRIDPYALCLLPGLHSRIDAIKRTAACLMRPAHDRMNRDADFCRDAIERHLVIGIDVASHLDVNVRHPARDLDRLSLGVHRLLRVHAKVFLQPIERHIHIVVVILPDAQSAIVHDEICARDLVVNADASAAGYVEDGQSDRRERLPWLPPFPFPFVISADADDAHACDHACQPALGEIVVIDQIRAVRVMRPSVSIAPAL